MSCFWNGLIKTLELNTTPYKFVEEIKERNCEVSKVSWKSKNEQTELTQQQKQENFQAIQELKPSSVNNGYDCSTFDPVLFLVSELYYVNIDHYYNSNLIQYIHKDGTRKITLHSNRGHLWA